jgi:hypothetical protein
MSNQAFPIFYHTHGPNGEKTEVAKGGLTKREHFAIMALQGILASTKLNVLSGNDLSWAAKSAMIATECLLEELNKEEINE